MNIWLFAPPIIDAGDAPAKNTVVTIQIVAFAV